MQFILVLSALGILSSVLATDYCSNNVCRRGKHHIACGNIGQFSSECPTDARLVDIRPHIEAILKSHNSKRNLIASGDLNGFEPAQRMASMQWDEELASLAELNVKQCRMKHDGCRNTDEFPSAGQNLASSGYSGNEDRRSDATLIEKAIDSWWNEYNDANMDNINSFSSNGEGHAIGHFTAMVRDSNIRVGCAASRYFEGKYNKFLLACNYATNNIVGSPIYSTGKTASACETGSNSIYPGLCSTFEKYYNHVADDEVFYDE